MLPGNCGFLGVVFPVLRSYDDGIPGKPASDLQRVYVIGAGGGRALLAESVAPSAARVGGDGQTFAASTRRCAGLFGLFFGGGRELEHFLGFPVQFHSIVVLNSRFQQLPPASQYPRLFLSPDFAATGYFAGPGGQSEMLD